MAEARLNGIVLNAANAVPVENARIRVQIPPLDETPEYEVRADPFGMFRIGDIAPGEYRLIVEHPGFLRHETNVVFSAAGAINRMVRLVPVDGKIVFDIYFQAFCLQTHAALTGGKVVAEYWKPGATLNGAPDAIFNGVLDNLGAVTLPAMEDGFYRLRAERTGWETLVYTPPPNSGFIVAGDKVRLSKAHFGSVFLRPVKQKLKVSVKGFDPVKNQPGQLLRGMTIHITGVDWTDDDRVLVPRVTAVSGDDGSFTFPNLAPIRWKVEVTRLGYRVSTRIVNPDANGALPEQVVDVELEPTKVKVIAVSLYRTSDAVKGSQIKLRGILNANNAGIEREAVAVAGTNHTASALFENLLPGRYWIHMQQEVTISGLPTNSGVLRGPGSFKVSFFPQESYVEAALSNTTELEIKLKPVPAVIRGRLMATDQLGNLLRERSDPEPNRIWRGVEQGGLSFLEHKLIGLLPETNNMVVVNSDAAGNYTALVPPGIYGVQIPTLTNYTGHNIEIGNLNSTAFGRTGPWPYPDIWPHATFEAGHHGAGLAFDSRQDYLLNLFVHRNYINVCGTIAPVNAPFSDLVLTMNRDASNPITYRYNHLFDVGAEVVASGPERYTAPVLSDNSYVLQDMKPGVYTLSVPHPQYTMPAKTITIAPWDPPGILPRTAPQMPGYYFPGITHLGPEFTLNPDWNSKGSLNIRKYDWIAGENPGYFSSGGGPPTFFRMEGLPERLFRYSRNIPAPSYTIWRNYGEDWFTASGSGPMDFEAYIGGPSPNVSPNKAPTDRLAYTVNLRAFSYQDRHYAISNVTVQFFGGATRQAVGEVPIDGSYAVQSATHAGGQWTYLSSENQLVSADRRLVEVNVFMLRASRVSVTVVSRDGPVPGAAVVLRNRYGNPISQRATDSEGKAVFAGVTPRAMYLEVSRRGYIPQRRSFVPAAENPDIDATFELEHVPPPKIDSFTMNRFGMFLPGVSRSKDALGTNPQNAEETLTLTWKAQARGSNYVVTLEGLRQPDESQGPPEVSKVDDPVAEVWVIDRRAFTNAFVNDLNQSGVMDNSAPAPLNYVNVTRWLESIVTARKNGLPYYVIHQNVVAEEEDASDVFEGDFKLWELPSGVFRPILLAITDGGGVAVADYNLPQGEGKPTNYLQGFNLPTWAANLTDVIGVAANLPEGEVDLHNRYGDGFVKIGSFSPKFEARIGLDPSTNSPENDSFLTYKYVIGVEVPLGEPTTEMGPMNMGPKFLGLKFSGASAEFEVVGKEMKAGLAINLGAAPEDEFKKLDKDYKPPISEGTEEGPENPEIDPEFSGKFAILETLQPDWQGRNRVSSFGYGIEAQGKVDVSAEFDATPVVGRFPYVGPVLTALDKLNIMTLFAQLEGTLGMKVNVEAMTEFPPYGTTTTSSGPDKSGFLGDTTLAVNIKLFVRIAGGLKISAAAGRMTGTALLQVGAPSTAPDLDGVTFTIDPLAKGNILKTIEGALSIILRAKLNLLTFNVSKEMQWDIARFVIDRSSEPSFELAPLNISYFVTSPFTALPQAFIGKETNLIENFYADGSLALAAGGIPALVFTGVDGSGKMVASVTVKSGGVWIRPFALGVAGAIISVAATQTSDGGVMIVWSEVAESDAGNVFPPTTLRYVRSAATGSGWSPEQTIATQAAALRELELAPSGNDVLLLAVAEPEGPHGPRQVVSRVWNGSEWGGQVVLPTEPVMGFEASGSPSGPALALVRSATGSLISLRWAAGAWGGSTEIGAGPGLALTPLIDGQDAFAAWVTMSNRLVLSKQTSQSGPWQTIATLSSNAPASDCEIAVITNSNEKVFVVAWAAGSDRNSLFYAMVDRNGAIRLPATEITAGSQGTYDRLELWPAASERASLIAAYDTGTNIIVREFHLGLPTAQDCDGDGVLDSEAIRRGLVADCNGNGVPDSCDLRAGRAADRDGDGILDACQAAAPDDCNRNGVSDRFELSLGIGDSNANGVIDECEGGLAIKVVPFPAAARQMYYRATELRLKTRTASTAELEYRGLLERSEDLRTWQPAP